MSIIKPVTGRMVVFKDGTYDNVKTLKGADLQEVDYSYADLRGEDFTEANLSKANFHKANLAGAILKRADLMGANLQGANLEDADLEGASMFDANLDGCSLSGADLRSSNIHCSRIYGATGIFPFFLPNIVAEEIVEGKPAIGIFVTVTIKNDTVILTIPIRGITMNFEESFAALERGTKNAGQKKVLMSLMQAAQEWAAIQRIN